MRFSNLRPYLVLVVIAGYAILARALHAQITGPSVEPIRELSWLPNLVLAVIVIVFLMMTLRGWEPSLVDRGLTLGKKFLPVLVFSALWILTEWWKGNGADAATQHGRLMQLIALVLVSEFVFRVIFPLIAFKLISRKGPWISALIVLVSGTLFVLIHPLHGSQLWWFGLSVFMSSITVFSGSILYGWIADLHYISDDSGIGVPPIYLIGMVAVYILVAAVRRYLVQRQALDSAPSGV